MKATIPTGFAAAIRGVKPLKNRIKPILGMIHVSAHASGSVTFRSTDIMATISVTVPATVTEPGECLLDPARLAKRLPSGEVWIVATADTVTVAGIPYPVTAEVTDYPSPPDISRVAHDVDAGRLYSALVRAVPAAGENNTRYVLATIQWDLESGRVVATDGSRLHVTYSPPVPGLACVLLPAEQVKRILPKLKKVKGECLVAVEDETAMLEWGDRDATTVWCCRSIDGQYPPWERVVPTDVPAAVVGIDTERMLSTLASLPPSESGTVTVTAADGVLSVSTYLGEGRYARLEAGETDSDLEFTINRQFLTDGLAVPGDQVRLAYYGKGKAITLSTPGRGDTAIIMPINI